MGYIDVLLCSRSLSFKSQCQSVETRVPLGCIFNCHFTAIEDEKVQCDILCKTHNQSKGYHSIRW